MNKGEKHIFGAILAIIVIAGGIAIFANGMGYTTILGNWKFPLSETGNGGNGGNNNLTDSQKLALGIGTFQAQTPGESSADANTLYTVGTAFNVNWYYSTGQYDSFGHKVYSRLLTEIPNPTVTQDLLNMRPEMNGLVYACVKIVGAGVFYVDYQKIQEDSYIQGYQFIDIDNSGQPSFVFTYNMKDHYIPSNNFPVITFKVYLQVQDPSFTSNLIDPSAFTGVTTASTTLYPKWYYTMTAIGDYIGIYMIEFKVNVTSLTEVQLKSMTIPGRGTVSGGSFHQWQTTTDTIWTLTLSEASYDGALYTGLLANQNNEFDITAQVTFTIPSGSVGCTLTLYYLNTPVMSGATEVGNVVVGP